MLEVETLINVVYINIMREYNIAHLEHLLLEHCHNCLQSNYSLSSAMN